METAQRVRLAAGDDAADRASSAAGVELSVVMPCLNEAETLGTCVRKASRAFEALGLDGEVVVADNGSNDGSRDIARSLGARLVSVRDRGYGSALCAGISAAKGEFIVIGDADDSYDFSEIDRFLGPLREGYELVMGNRFRGRIEPGAMPWLHRFVGNPCLSGFGRLLFHSAVGDFHCGLRGFTKKAYERMQLQTTGMEFASEMVIRAALLGLRTTEVPVTLYPDGRSRPPHLRTWRDGWRHLRFMLLFSPNWLFLVPGGVLLALGLALALILLPGPFQVGAIVFDVHTLLCGVFSCLIGYQLIVFAVFTKIFAIVEGLHPPSLFLEKTFRYITLEIGLLCGILLSLCGAALLGTVLWEWAAEQFGGLDPRSAMRRLIPALGLIALGFQTIFASFFLSILGLRRRRALPRELHDG